ncbi:MAG: hypothetical protein R2822_05600 [Spirosomataceae bacterium]
MCNQQGPGPRPQQGPHTWHIARFDGKNWQIFPVTTSDHNYDMGSLYIESNTSWKIIGPTEPGPQAYGTGGEVAVWKSADQGKTWQKEADLTQNSAFNHSYIRRPQYAHPIFMPFGLMVTRASPLLRPCIFLIKKEKCFGYRV